MPVEPQKIWWCAMCGGPEVVADERPACDSCTKLMADMGWRVGYGSSTYAYYSTRDFALRDKRVATGRPRQ